MKVQMEIELLHLSQGLTVLNLDEISPMSSSNPTKIGFTRIC